MIIIIFCDKDIDFVTYFQETFVNFTIMNKKEIFAIGLMSGTSLDGIDLVYVKFLKKEYSFFEIIHAETVLPFFLLILAEILVCCLFL